MPADPPLFRVRQPAPGYARSTVGQARQVGILLQRLRDADWPGARAQAAMIHGIASFALADANEDKGLSLEYEEVKVAGAKLLAAAAALNSDQREDFAGRLQTMLQDANHHGDFLPALLKLVSEGDSGFFEKIYEDSWERLQPFRAHSLAHSSALGMLSVALRGHFWASFNIAYRAGSPQDLENALTAVKAVLEDETQCLEQSELEIHAAAAGMDFAGLLRSRVLHGARTMQIGIRLATALAHAVRTVDDLYAAGRNNAALRELQSITADGLRLAQRAHAGAIAVQLLPDPASREQSSGMKLLKQARYASPYVNREVPTATSTLPDGPAEPAQTVRVTGRVQHLKASRIEGNRKLVTTVTLTVSPNDPPIHVRADFHDLGHEGLTVGAYFSATGKVIEVDGTKMLRVGRVSMSDPARDGWITALYATAKPWIELTPGGLDLRWSPGKGTKVSAESETSGVGVGNVIYNKPVPTKGYKDV